jgi:hypothetical protein
VWENVTRENVTNCDKVTSFVTVLSPKILSFAVRVS